jgi:hypothetical protein
MDMESYSETLVSIYQIRNARNAVDVNSILHDSVFVELRCLPQLVTYRGVRNMRISTRGADKSLALQRKQQTKGLKKFIYSTYLPLHTPMTSLF